MCIKMKLKNYKLRIGITLVAAMALVGCGTTAANTTDIEMSFSNFSGTKEKEIFLNSDDNELNLDGTIKIKKGEAELYVKVKDTNEILYSRECTSKENGNISIDINDLDENKDLVLVLEAKNAKEVKLQLNSKQKLVLDKEVPKPL